MFNVFVFILTILYFLTGSIASDDALVRLHILEIYKKCEAEKETGAKSYKLDISDNGFIRYRKVLQNNKTEYYSARVDKIEKINFYGNDKGGWLSLSFEQESVICQTYKDPLGDVDSMGNEINFPLKNIDVEELNLLDKNFKSLKQSFKNTIN